jgi:hypothetical protein
MSMERTIQRAAIQRRTGKRRGQLHAATRKLRQAIREGERKVAAAPPQAQPFPNPDPAYRKPKTGNPKRKRARR